MIITLALFAPVAILFMAYVIDLGDTFNHKRHLQVQADAGALATARQFNACFTDKPTGNSSVYQVAGQYGGVTTVTAPASVSAPPSGTIVASTPLYNPQIGGTAQSNLHALINSQTYYNQGSPVDSGVPATNADPCTAEMADVKLTETNLPWYFQALGVPNINAHARVSLLEETSKQGALPVAARQPLPQKATAYFIDESSGQTINTCGTSGTSACSVDVTQDASGNWSNTSAPLPMTITSAHPSIGVRVALSGDPTTSTCGAPSVLCYDTNANTGVLHIQGWSSGGTGSLTAPLARRVTLSTTGAAGWCSDAYFSNATSSCTFSISANVDIGTSNTKGVTVTPVIGGTNGAALTYDSSTGLWTGNQTLTAGSGSNQIDLQVKCNKNTAGSPCAGRSTSATITNVQRTYSANPNTSGPIVSATIADNTASSPDPHSFEYCETGNTKCAPSFVVTFGLSGGLQNNTGQLVSLRIAGGSQSQEVDCGVPPGQTPNIRTMLQFGCYNTYAKNTSPTLACSPPATPPQCVPIKTGEAVGQVSQGLQARFADTGAGNCGGVYPNNTVNGVWNGQPDPRVVTVFVTPFDSFSGSGNGIVPILKFATMYAAGWAGDSCTTDPADPAGAGKGDIWGYFINYVDTLGATGGSKCDVTSFGACVAVLTQ